MISAFSINWPYVAFAGLNDYLIICNGYDQEFLHRVEMAPACDKINICQTIISDTNDLFAMIYSKRTYKLFMIDLDASNVNEQEEMVMEKLKRDPASLYYEGAREPILEYHDEQVQEKQLGAMHIRGASRKEMIDFDEKLMVLLLHGYYLYSWVQYNPREKGSKLTLIQRVATKSLRVANDSMLFIMQNNIDKESKKIQSQEIKKIELNFSGQNISTVFTGNS